MSQDQILCISYFDQVIGPSNLYCSEPLIETVGAPDLGKILEFNDEEGTFIFAYRKYQTVNHIFYIDSRMARGGKELLMITYMIKTAIFKDGLVDVFKYLDSKTPILEDFASELKDLHELSPLLHVKKSAFSEGGILNLAEKELKNSFLDMFNKYFRKLTPEYQLATPMRKKRLIKKIFIVGAPRAGKTTLLKNIELIQFLNIKDNDLPTRIYEVIVENLEILEYDKMQCKFSCKGFDSFEECLTHAQGLILIFDASNKTSLTQTKEMFQTIDDKRLEMKCELVPVLIIGNKIYNKEVFKPESIHETFEIKELKEAGMRIRYYPINILEEDVKIMRALRWLIKNML